MNKSIAISIITFIGLSFIGIFTYTSVSSIKTKNNQLEIISQKQNHLKSILIGGLLFNSASGVLHQNPKSTMARKSMEEGAQKVSSFVNKLKKIDTNIYNSIAKPFNDFNTFTTSLISSKRDISKQDLKLRLKYWRALKLKVMDITKDVNKEAEKTTKEFHKLIDSTIFYILSTIIIAMVVIILLNTIVLKTS